MKTSLGQLTWGIAGMLLSIAFFDDLFPMLTERFGDSSSGRAVVAGIQAGIGIALGMVAFELYKRLSRKRSG